MSTADPDDVKGVIATDLTDPEIQSYLDDAEFEAKAAITDYDTDRTTEEKTQLEKYLAALRIREIRDKAINSTSRETASVDYEGMTLAALRKEVEKRDPSGTLAYNTNSNRYVNSGP
jgi:hypothetical protein